MLHSNTTGYEKLFMLKAQLTYKLNLPIPNDTRSAKTLQAKKKKYEDYLMEINEVNSRVEYYEIDDEDFISVKENIFYKNLKRTSYDMKFDGTYVKLALLHTDTCTKWVIWCKNINTV